MCIHIYACKWIYSQHSVSVCVGMGVTLLHAVLALKHDNLCACVRAYIYIHIHMYMHIFVYVCIYIYTYVYVCMYIYIYMETYACVCVYVQYMQMHKMYLWNNIHTQKDLGNEVSPKNIDCIRQVADHYDSLTKEQVRERERERERARACVCLCVCVYVCGGCFVKNGLHPARSGPLQLVH